MIKGKRDQVFIDVLSSFNVLCGTYNSCQKTPISLIISSPDAKNPLVSSGISNIFNLMLTNVDQF